MLDIGSRIRDERILKGLSQKEVAAHLGIKQNTVSQYENNIKQPSYDVLVLLAKYFNVTTDYLLGRADI